MSALSQRTATPYRVAPAAATYVMASTDGPQSLSVIVAKCARASDAEFIVKACNMHARAVETLGLIVSYRTANDPDSETGARLINVAAQLLADLVHP